MNKKLVLIFIGLLHSFYSLNGLVRAPSKKAPKRTTSEFKRRVKRAGGAGQKKLKRVTDAIDAAITYEEFLKQYSSANKVKTVLTRADRADIKTQVVKKLMEIAKPKMEEIFKTDYAAKKHIEHANAIKKTALDKVKLELKTAFNAEENQLALSREKNSLAILEKQFNDTLEAEKPMDKIAQTEIAKVEKEQEAQHTQAEGIEYKSSERHKGTVWEGLVDDGSDDEDDDPEDEGYGGEEGSKRDLKKLKKRMAEVEAKRLEMERERQLNDHINDLFGDLVKAANGEGKLKEAKKALKKTADESGAVGHESAGIETGKSEQMEGAAKVKTKTLNLQGDIPGQEASTEHGGSKSIGNTTGESETEDDGYLSVSGSDDGQHEHEMAGRKGDRAHTVEHHSVASEAYK
jgi:hypothetical protein